jgi:transglutaminase-like putative cysteine protease
MRLSIRHRTCYRFTAPQVRVIQLARLTPANSGGQAVLSWDMTVDSDVRLRPARDGYGNHLTMLYVDGPIDELMVEVAGEILTQDQAGVVRNAPEPLPPTVFLRESPLTHGDEAIAALADAAREAGVRPLEQMHGLMRLIGARMRYDTGGTDVERNASEALELGHGVCQDLTHIFCAAARRLDVPARYVSGHLYQRGTSDDQTAAHAWAEAWIEGLGWVGFDAVNGISPDDAYVRVAVGLDYREAAPLAGARIGAGEERLDVSIRVEQTGRR